MKAYLKKYPNGMYMIENDHGDDVFPKLKVDEVIRVEARKVRDYHRHKTMMKLFRIVYDHFCEYEVSEVIYEGERLTPDFDAFRKRLTILAGYYVPSYGIDGKVELEAQSLAYDECDQDKFEKIFGAVIGAAIKFIYKGRRTPESLKQQVIDEVLRFAPNH